MLYYIKRFYIKFFISFSLILFPVILVALSDCQATPFQEESKEPESEEEKKAWTAQGRVHFNLNQYSYSNWTKGGENALSWSTRLDVEINFQQKPWGWEFANLMEFGQVKLGDERIRNSKDKIDMNTAVLYSTGSVLSYYIGGSLLTRFTKGYNYETSPPEVQTDFWDPAYLTQSAGVQFQVKEVLKSKIGVGCKQTITRQMVRYTDKPATSKIEKYRFENGIESKTTFDMQVFKNLHIRSLLNVFSSFDHPDEVDINWDSLFITKMNSFLTFSFNIQVVYDGDIIDKVQIKEELGIGVLFSVF